MLKSSPLLVSRPLARLACGRVAAPLLSVPAYVRGFATRKKQEPDAHRKSLLKHDSRTYEEVYNTFKWEVPEFFNIGVEICDKHLPHRRFQDAIIYEDDKGVKKYMWEDLHKLSNMFANALTELGVEREDRIAVSFVCQVPEAAISHITTYKMGCIAVPLFSAFGPDAIEYRLKASEARVVITDKANLDKILEIKANLPELQKVIVTGIVKDLPEGCVGYHEILFQHGKLDYTPVKTRADDPAVIIFTSGTTGDPKGCLHAHRVLLGHLPGVEFPHNLFPQPIQDYYTFYTPADWAWIGGLFDVLLPALYHGVPVLAHRSKFEPLSTLELMRKHHVRHTFMPPTALKRMRMATNLYKTRFLVSVGAGGESLGDKLMEWGREMLGVTINEFYGQTEANLLVGNCSKIMRVKSGSMGKAIPGHQVEIVDDKGNIVPSGQIGHIAVKAPDPVVFLQYWKNKKATEDKFRGDWCVTGDLGRKDDEGYFWYVGRDDDLINSSGYRIGPGEVENTLLKHKDVNMCAVIGAPDPMRGEIVKAFIVLRDNVEATPELKTQIQQFVKTQLAAHEYPREIEFVKALPMTHTGKILRRTLRDQEVAKMRERQGDPSIGDLPNQPPPTPNSAPPSEN